MIDFLSIKNNGCKPSHQEELAAIAVSFSAISIFSFGTHHRVGLQHYRKHNQTDAHPEGETHFL
jgi:hypothetical protein